MNKQSSPLSRALINIPNALTAIRILAIPAVVFLLYGAPSPKRLLWAAIVFALALITDFFDGLLARRMQSVTALGKTMDPMADKLMVMTGLLMILALGYVDVLIVLVLLGRELIINTLRALAAPHGIFLPSTQIARAKVWVEGFGVALVMLGPDNRWLNVDWMHLGLIVLYSSVVLALWSAAQYFQTFIKASQSR